MASWILTPPGDLTEDNRAALAQITTRCAELQATRALVRYFADMAFLAALLHRLPRDVLGRFRLLVRP